MDINNLIGLLPQNHPFLFLDEVINVEPRKSLVAIKNVTANEWFFQGRNENFEYYPETLLIENAAQAVIALGREATNGKEEDHRYFIGKVKAEFFEMVRVGDQVKFDVSMGKIMRRGGYAEAKVSVDNKRIADISMFFHVQEVGK